MDTSDRYRLVRRIGQGEYTQIYLAYDKRLAMKKVVKMLKEDADSDSLKRQQFIAEILLMRELQHPCLPHISDIILEGDTLMVVMDYVEGETLQAYVRKYGIQEEAVVVDWGIQLAEFFEYLHGRHPPVIHRDLKPSNIICHPSGRLVLLDFGIAVTGENQGEWCQGTVGYAAPEQYIAGEPCDERTDIYAFGRTLLFCLAGDPMEMTPNQSTPFYNNISYTRDVSYTDKISYMDDISYTDNISYTMRRILMRCTCQKKEDRYQSMTECKEELLFLRNSQKDGVHPGSGIQKERFGWLPGSWKERIPSLKDKWKVACGKTMIGLVLLLLLTRTVLGEYHRREAIYYVDSAIEMMDLRKKLPLFDQALQEAPQEISIYQGILESYLKPQHFSGQAVAETLNLYEKNRALSVLKRKNPDYYGEYCYEMGIGYFYEMGGIAGKKESNLWFRRALEYDKNLSRDRRRRADLYQRISEYYQSFLTEGEDPSGEEGKRSYVDFFHILQELNEDCIESLSNQKKKASEADQKAIMCGFLEVVQEIRTYSRMFLQENIQGKDLCEELDRIDEICCRGWQQVGQEEREHLMELTAAARKTIQIMEGYHE